MSSIVSNNHYLKQLNFDIIPDDSLSNGPISSDGTSAQALALPPVPGTSNSTAEGQLY